MQKHLIVDNIRLSDLAEFDTPADTLEQARALADEMCQKTGITCHVLAVVGTVHPGLTLTWEDTKCDT